MSKYPNSGTLNKNLQKRDEKSPDYFGKAEVEGVEYKLGAWIKEGNGGKFMSISFRRADEQPQRPAAPPVSKPPEDDPEVPF